MYSWYNWRSLAAFYELLAVPVFIALWRIIWFGYVLLIPGVEYTKYSMAFVEWNYDGLRNRRNVRILF